jgi:hypothetical protein
MTPWEWLASEKNKLTADEIEACVRYFNSGEMSDKLRPEFIDLVIDWADEEARKGSEDILVVPNPTGIHNPAQYFSKIQLGLSTPRRYKYSVLNATRYKDKEAYDNVDGDTFYQQDLFHVPSPKYEDWQKKHGYVDEINDMVEKANVLAEATGDYE